MWFALLIACTPTPEPPAILGVSPGFGYYRDSTPIQIAGDNFFPQVTLRGDDPSGGQVEDGVQVWLEGPEERRIVSRLVNIHAIEAEVPEQMTVGTYDLRVVTPSGEEAIRTDAFEVTGTRADHLQLSADSVAWSVGETAELHISVRDPEDQAVNQTLQVKLIGSDADGLATLTYGEGLDRQEAVEGGVVGWLAEDGSGTVRVSSEVANNLSFTATPVDEQIDGDTLLMNWSPGGLASAELTFENGTPSSITAGVPFKVHVRLIDSLGNTTPDETAAMIFFESAECGNWRNSQTIKGEGTVTVTLTTPCPDNLISGYVADKVVTSPHFDVVPGPISKFQVAIPTSTVLAGTGELPMLIEAVDKYGNLVSDYSKNVSFEDAAGGLNTNTGIGSVNCSIFVGGQQICSATMLTAATGNTITVRDPDAIEGTSNLFDVQPNSPSQVGLQLASTNQVAGQSFVLTVTLQDAWQNGVDFDPQTTTVSLSDDDGPIDCSLIGPNLNHGQDYSCLLTRAVSATHLHATVGTVEGSLQDPVTVENGALSKVTISLQGPLEAGAPAYASFAGFDAWDNPYLVQRTAPLLDLSDSSGTLTPTSLSLNAVGTGSASLTITRAGTTVVSASMLGTLVGTSAPVLVTPGSPASLQLNLPGWVEVGQKVPVTVTAIDAWGNTASSFHQAGTLGGTSGLCDSVSLDSFVDGVALVDVPCTQAGLAEILSASADGLSGSSSSLDVVDFACSDGPTAALSLDSSTELVACLISGSVTVHADAASSTGGSRNIVVYHYDDGLGTQERSTSNSFDFTWTSAGYRSVGLVVADASACADQAQINAWIGEDDGSPTGPIAMVTGASSVANASSTTLSLSATDCAGDPATGTVQVIADLGDLLATSTGSGLTLNLDAFGAATTTWSFSSGYATTATAVVGTAASGGSTSVTVTGDAVRPSVVEVTPSGFTADLSTIVVTFSEAIRASSLGSSTISLTGPNGLEPISYSLSADGKTLTILSSAGTGAYQLDLTSGIRDDVQGNRLDGAWSGGASTFSVDLGDVSVNLPTINGCLISSNTFYPDGDPGLGEEDDEVAVTVLAATAPRWWWTEIFDESGTRVQSLRNVGTDYGTTWDGRGLDGRTVSSGSYTLDILAVDDNGNLGSPCEVTVEVSQHVRAP